MILLIKGNVLPETSTTMKRREKGKKNVCNKRGRNLKRKNCIIILQTFVHSIDYYTCQTRDNIIYCKFKKNDARMMQNINVTIIHNYSTIFKFSSQFKTKKLYYNLIRSSIEQSITHKKKNDERMMQNINVTIIHNYNSNYLQRLLNFHHNLKQKNCI